MLFKIDENLHEDAALILRQNGHDAVSVFEQQLRGASDVALGQICHREGRVILTQDLDFANILAFPPDQYAGIIVLRLHDPSRMSVLTALRRLLPLFSISRLRRESLKGLPVQHAGMAARLHVGQAASLSHSVPETTTKLV